jgi:hypothetical protein
MGGGLVRTMDYTTGIRLHLPTYLGSTMVVDMEATEPTRASTSASRSLRERAVGESRYTDPYSRFAV